MKKRRSYSEVEPVKKKENSVWRGFVNITIKKKQKQQKERLQNLYSCITSFQKKSKGSARLYMFCLVFGQLPH